jgi:hypothetical protein
VTLGLYWGSPARRTLSGALCVSECANTFDATQATCATDLNNAGEWADRPTTAD